MKMPPPVIENKYSRLLTTDQHIQVFKLLGNRCQSICTTVAQMFVTEPPNHSQWFKKDCGVLCFVKDNSRKNYFFRLFCVNRNVMVWEQELYKNLEYNESTLFLHIFEGEDTIIAFNFANSDEARDFKMAVDEKLQQKKRRDDRQRSRQQNKSPSPQPFAYNSQTLKEPHDYKRIQDPVVKQAKRKRNITKADIGIPLDFKHISHVGWNAESGFDIDVQDEKLNYFFEKAGISEKQLRDRDTKEFIYDFINKHGGREAVESATTRRAPAAPPVPQTLAVPPVPPRGPPRPHVRVAPPPPPMTSPSFVEQEKVVPPPPPMVDFSAAPPPPPIPIFSESEAAVPAAPTMGSALLKSIQGGTTLRPVEERKMPSPVDDSRGDLLKQIRAGTKLKPLCEREVNPVAQVEQPKGGDLAEALSRALAERSKAFYSEDDDDEEDSNEDEWDD